jgi:hypothetical protein
MITDQNNEATNGGANMATLIHESTKGSKTHEALSTSHVRIDTDGILAIELPFFVPHQGAEAIYLRMEKREALELAARITNTIAHEL